MTKNDHSSAPKAYLTYDYEVFFGQAEKNQIDSLIVPADILLEHLKRLGVNATFFVDIGYLIRLRALTPKHPRLGADLARMEDQLQRMQGLGHDLQLHIHPHWEDASFDGEKWVFDMSRYRIHTFSDDDIRRIVDSYTSALNEYRAGQPASIFRAGGWCIQPFERLKEHLLRNGIHIDSTVYRGGRVRALVQQFDFRKAPKKNSWRFEDDPCVEAPGGSFTELPIASHRFWPLAYWRVAVGKVGDQRQHRPFVAGRPTPSGPMTLLKLLLVPSTGVVSLDGYRSRYLIPAWKRRPRNTRHFIALGHPKAMTPYSLDRLSEFVNYVSPRHFNVLSDIKVESLA